MVGGAIPALTSRAPRPRTPLQPRPAPLDHRSQVLLVPMAPALSKDLVWRIVKKRLLYDDTFESISRQLDLPVSTVHKIFTRVEQRHGDLETYQGMRVALPANSKLDGQQRMDLFQLICTADAGMQLNEIAVEFRNRYGIHLEVYDIARAMVVHNFTHKRVSSRTTLPTSG